MEKRYEMLTEAKFLDNETILVIGANKEECGETSTLIFYNIKTENFLTLTPRAEKVTKFCIKNDADWYDIIIAKDKLILKSMFEDKVYHLEWDKGTVFIYGLYFKMVVNADSSHHVIPAYYVFNTMHYSQPYHDRHRRTVFYDKKGNNISSGHFALVKKKTYLTTRLNI